jgi:hypothetical protein
MGNLFGKQKCCNDDKATPGKPKTSKNDPKTKETKPKPSDKNANKN